MLHVLAYITAKPGRRNTVVQESGRTYLRCTPKRVVSSTFLLLIFRHSGLPRYNLGRTPLS